MGDRWTEVDRYLESRLVPPDPVLTSALASAGGAGLPEIQVSPLQGQFLHVLARALRARRILEVGTLGAYSTIWLARALPRNGRLLSLELRPRHAEVARANLARAGLSDRVEVRVGPALESLPRLAAERPKPFDLVFLDADKPPTTEYFDWAVRLSHPGTVIVVDNVVRDGKVADASNPEPSVQGMRRFFDSLANDRRVRATVVATVGAKGYDGFAVAYVERPTADPRGRGRRRARASREGSASR